MFTACYSDVCVCSSVTCEVILYTFTVCRDDFKQSHAYHVIITATFMCMSCDNHCRYFQCPPKHGLFAPLPKVEKLADSGLPPEEGVYMYMYIHVHDYSC